MFREYLVIYRCQIEMYISVMSAYYVTLVLRIKLLYIFHFYIAVLNSNFYQILKNSQTLSKI